MRIASEVVVGEGVLTVTITDGEALSLIVLTPDVTTDLIAKLQCGLRELHREERRKERGCTHPAYEPCFQAPRYAKP